MSLILAFVALGLPARAMGELDPFFEAGGKLGVAGGRGGSAPTDYGTLGAGGGLSLTVGASSSPGLQVVGRTHVALTAPFPCLADAPCWNQLLEEQGGLELGLRWQSRGDWVAQLTGGALVARNTWNDGPVEFNWGATGAFFVGKISRARHFDWLLGTEVRLDYLPVMAFGGFAHLDFVMALRLPRR